MSRLKKCDVNRDNILVLICKIDLIAFCMHKLPTKTPLTERDAYLDVLVV